MLHNTVSEIELVSIDTRPPFLNPFLFLLTLALFFSYIVFSAKCLRLHLQFLDFNFSTISSFSQVNHESQHKVKLLTFKSVLRTRALVFDTMTELLSGMPAFQIIVPGSSPECSASDPALRSCTTWEAADDGLTAWIFTTLVGD